MAGRRLRPVTVVMSLAAMAPVWAGRAGSYLVIGDWGWDEYWHGDITNVTCQKAIADQMHQTMQQLGDVKFIINVGDSFYPAGVTSKDDLQWDKKWRFVYSDLLRSVPWYSVYGNHDYMLDPCACSEDANTCAQVHGDINNKGYLYMPSTHYFIEHPELHAEVVGLDTNFVWQQYLCQWTKCAEACRTILKKRMDESLALLNERMEKSTAKNMLVFSHYPTDYFPQYPDFIAKLRDGSKRHVDYFGGHRHNVDQTTVTSTAPNSNWLVGGGGGWSCDGLQQGFLVGELPDDGSPATTRPVLLDPQVCCAASALMQPRVLKV